MAYDHAQRNDADYYDDSADASPCEKRGQEHEECKCQNSELEREDDHGQPEGLFDDYLKSGDEKDLPF